MCRHRKYFSKDATRFVLVCKFVNVMSVIIFNRPLCGSIRTYIIFGCVFATGMVIYSRLIKPPGRTAEMLPPWRYCMFRNCLTDALSRRPAPFTPIKGRITHLYNCCNLIPQDWLMSQRWHRGSNPGPSGYKQDALTTGLSPLALSANNRSSKFCTWISFFLFSAIVVFALFS